jgi:hypothetical protein
MIDHNLEINRRRAGGDHGGTTSYHGPVTRVPAPPMPTIRIKPARPCPTAATPPRWKWTLGEAWPKHPPLPLVAARHPSLIDPEAARAEPARPAADGHKSSRGPGWALRRWVGRGSSSSSARGRAVPVMGSSGRSGGVDSPVGRVRRVAVLRCNALGDYVMATPALAALRQAFPEAEITLLASAWHDEFLSGRPGPVDRVLVLPHVPGLAGQPAGAPGEDALGQFLAAARTYRYDLAVQLHGGGAASNPLVSALGARWSIGLRAENAAALDATVPYRYYQSEVFRFLEVVALVGAQGSPEYPELAVSAREQEVAAGLLPAGRPWVALHGGAGDPRRRWAADRFAHGRRRTLRRGYPPRCSWGRAATCP